MLSSLAVHNYRNLRRLTIGRLGRVNLIVGKNNTGKTALLEAISIHINDGSFSHILQLLDERGENYAKRNTEGSKGNDILKTVSALFSDRKPGYLESESIVIGELDNTLFGTTLAAEARTLMKFVRYVELFDESTDEQSLRRRRIFLDEDDVDTEAQIGLDIRFRKQSTLVPLLSAEGTSRPYTLGRVVRGNDSEQNRQFVRTKNIDREINGYLWDRISLTSSEDEVVNALRIIESDIDRVTFRNERSQERIAVVKLRSSNDVVPLRSMGDGINRILTIILAMVNCEDGYLLIDEFENGLHYSVQEKLWQIVFTVAERLNVQVFATTHSNDCVESFAAILSTNQFGSDAGYLIRLDQYEGKIESTLYNSEEVQSTTRVQVDPR